MLVIEKPWGREEILEINGSYMMKRLTMLAKHRCSLQYHQSKRETIYVLSGKLRIDAGPTLDELVSNVFIQNQSITIGPGVIHRMEAVTDSIYLEASTPEMDDVVRIEDDYKRVKT